PYPPIAADPAAETPRLFLIDARTQSNCLFLQLLATAIQQRDQRISVVVIKYVGVTGNLLAQYRQVVIVAEMIRQLVGLADQLSQQCRPDRLKDLQLMPQVLDLL